MATSSPLHSGGSASRQPSSHSQHGITAPNAALPSRKVEGLLDHLRPWSGSLSCGAPPRPRPLPFAHASHADARTKTGVCARAVRAHQCLGFFRRPPCGERQGSRIISARAWKGVKRDRTCCPPTQKPSLSPGPAMLHACQTASQPKAKALDAVGYGT